MQCCCKIGTVQNIAMKEQHPKNSISMWRKVSRQLLKITSDHSFLNSLEAIEGVVSKVLSIAMVIVILVSIWHLGTFLLQTLFAPNDESYTNTLFKIFGLFLNVLIALEILENITAYLKKHVIQVELVIVTSLIAVARKIIILDLEKTAGIELIGLAVAIFSLAVSYLIIKYTNTKKDE